MHGPDGFQDAESSCTRLEMDEIWGFVGKKERNVRMDDDAPSAASGRSARSMPIPNWFRRSRSESAIAATANAFVQDVASRMANRVQISTDGLRAYVDSD